VAAPLQLPRKIPAFTRRNPSKNPIFAGESPPALVPQTQINLAPLSLHSIAPLRWRVPPPAAVAHAASKCDHVSARARGSPAGTRQRQTLLGCSPSGEPKGAAILCRFGRWSLVVEWSPRTDYDGLLPRAVTSLASPNEQSLLLSSAHRNPNSILSAINSISVCFFCISRGNC